MLLAVFVLALLPLTMAGPNFDKNQVKKLQQRLDKGEKSEKVFKDFKNVFKKKYKNGEEEKLRLKHFKNNANHIKGHNALYKKGAKSFSLAVNAFADMTHEEFLQKYTGMKETGKGSKGFTAVHESSHAQLPITVDWRANGTVTAVKNQIGSLEGQVARKTGNLVSLSEQQLVDCDVANYGCDGGWMEKAFDYITSAGGVVRQEDYPYTAAKGNCTFNASNVVQGTEVSSYVAIPRGNESELQHAVALVGPVVIAIDSSPDSFWLYSEGVYYDCVCSSSSLNHGVLVVGYGVDAEGQEYWLVKNSWGDWWGDNGYMRVARNRDNHCGVATYASYPLLNKCSA